MTLAELAFYYTVILPAWEVFFFLVHTTVGPKFYGDLFCIDIN